MSGALLITGFPNLTSRVLLRRLLTSEAPPERVFVLVSPGEEALANAFLSAVDAQGARRVELLEGRLAAIDFGLGGQEYKALARQLSEIHHLAPILSPSADRNLTEQVNIGGTREILELARSASELEKVLFYSSVLVSGDRSGRVLEEELQADQGFRSPAERTLATAERMLRGCMAELPIIVLRPSLLSCDSRSGEADPGSPLAQLLSLLLRSPEELPVFMPGRGEFPVHLVPVDFLVDAALCIARWPQAPGKTFHITDPQPPRVQQLFDAVRHSQGRTGSTRALPLPLGRALFNVPGPLSWAQTPRMLMELMTTDVRYDAKNAQQALLGSSLSCPPLPSYLGPWLGQLRAQQRGTQP